MLYVVDEDQVVIGQAGRIIYRGTGLKQMLHYGNVIQLDCNMFQKRVILMTLHRLMEYFLELFVPEKLLIMRNLV